MANGTGTATVNSQMLYRTAYIGVDLNVTSWAVSESMLHRLGLQGAFHDFGPAFDISARRVTREGLRVQPKPQSCKAI